MWFRRNAAQLMLVILFAAPCNIAWAAQSEAANAAPSLKSSFDRVDTWIEGKVTAVDPANGTLTMQGVKLPFATMHAQMRKEFEQKMSKSTPAKRQEIVEQLNKEWRGKLIQAQNEKPGAPMVFNLTSPSNGDIVLLERKSVQDVTFAYQPETAKSDDSNIAAELVSIDIYDVPAPTAETSTASGKTLQALHLGDVVKIGADVNTNEACVVILLSGSEANAR